MPPNRDLDPELEVTAARKALGPFERTFETQVLISLAEIKGQIALIAEREKSTRLEVDGLRAAMTERAKYVDSELKGFEHAMNRIRSHQASTRGVAIALATLLPLLLGVLQFVVLANQK